MFKRIIAFILLFVFMCFKCITWVPSAAMTGIPAFDAFYYAIMQSMGMAVTNGVDLDLSEAIAEVRENIPDYLQQPDVALKYLLRSYAGKAWDYIALNWENSSTFTDVGLAETAAIGLANASGVSVPTLQDIVTQWSGKALDLDKDITTPIDSNTVSFWNKFNNLWINQYLDRINALPAGTEVPQPDLTYAQQLDVINVSGYNSFKYNIQVLNTNYNVPSMIIFDDSLSYCTFNDSVDPKFGRIGCFPVASIFIYGADDNYHYECNFNLIDNFSFCNAADGSFAFFGNNGGRFNSQFNSSQPDLGTYWGGWSYNYVSTPTYTETYSGTLSAVLNHISYRFHNINIYVNDTLWSSAGGNITSNFTASVPNAVIDSGTDDGKIVANPIYWVVDNNTGTPIDSQINLDKLIDYLNGVIDGTNSDTSVDFGDLVDNGIIEKQDGTAITDADVISVPVSDVIDDSISRADPLVIPIAITGTLPPLPPLPPFFPTPDFPEGDPTSGFNGMSVLARIINITNQSLPDSVVITFYGVIFGAVVLGLIKILHK